MLWGNVQTDFLFCGYNVTCLVFAGVMKRHRPSKYWLNLLMLSESDTKGVVDTEGRQKKPADRALQWHLSSPAHCKSQWWTNSVTPTGKGMSGWLSGDSELHRFRWSCTGWAGLNPARGAKSNHSIGWKAPHHRAVQGIVRRQQSRQWIFKVDPLSFHPCVGSFQVRLAELTHLGFKLMICGKADFDLRKRMKWSTKNRAEQYNLKTISIVSTRAQLM